MLSEKDGLDSKNVKEKKSFKEALGALDKRQVDQNTEASLQERIKELTCLYGITQHIMQEHDSKDEIFQGIVEHIPPAWQYPEITVGRILIDDRVYVTSDFKKAYHKQTSDIIIDSEKRGVVEVVYTKKIPKVSGVLFLKEERNLIDAIAKQVALTLERQEVEEERKKLQEQLIHSDRLATIGQLSSGIAHELNEPLNNILGLGQLMEQAPETPAQFEEDIKEIIAHSLHAREIIKKLMLFARQLPPQKIRVNLNQVIEDGLYLLESRCANSGIELIRVLSPDIPKITADPSQLNQVLVNLVVNAIQAMPDGGRLTIETKSDKENVKIVVKDTGIGMSEEVRKQIFVPFFTTKDIDHGTGLGLPVIHGIIASHGGTIEVESTEGKGSLFEAIFPVKSSKRNKKGNDNVLVK